MFLGESVHNMDAKGRVFVPKRFQDELDRNEEGQHRVILTRGFEGCLFLFSHPGFERVMQRMETQAFGGSELRTMQRLFFANTHQATLDNSGRLLVPEKLKRHAALEKELVMVGAADRAEIWARSAWEAFEAGNDADFDRLGQVLCGGAAADETGT